MKETDPIRVLLADDDTLVRAGLSALLEKMASIEVVAEAANGREALDQLVETAPDVMLLDINMPKLNGIEVTRRALQIDPDVGVVILSVHSSERHVRQALKAGAAGYLAKSADITELELALKSVMAGKIYLSPSISAHVVSGYVDHVADVADPLDALTPRQREVFQLVVEGHTTRQIANILSISVKTVETHRLQMMERLGIFDVPGLVRYAMRIGLIRE
jgi:DNA-binding NarL/FixJ family response regulator